ncbi:MAG: type II secretion system F family protein [Agathobacter sp.]|nr:type II secretion system F family protein [Agathobacter sp.]
MNKKKIALLILCLLLPLGAAMWMEQRNAGILQNGNLHRNPHGEGNQEITLLLDAEGVFGDYKYELTVPEVKLTKEEVEILFAQTMQEIEQDFSDVTLTLPLRKTYQQDRVNVTWEFFPTGIVDSEGKISLEGIPKEGLLLSCNAYMECQDYQQIYQFALEIPKPEENQKDQLIQEIGRYLDNEMAMEGKEEISLPTQMQGISLHWSVAKEGRIYKILLIEILALGLWRWSKVAKRKQEEKEYQKEVEDSYPDIVGQLTLLIAAGMTPAQAIQKIGTKGNPKGAVLEFANAANRLKQGEREREVLLFLEARLHSCLSYRRLIRILLHHLGRGGEDLCRELELESTKAYSKQLQEVRRMGEEGATKMLAPLFLMLLVVFAIVLSPALMQLGG